MPPGKRRSGEFSAAARQIPAAGSTVIWRCRPLGRNEPRGAAGLGGHSGAAARHGARHITPFGGFARASDAPV
eukprot:8041338-Pyramimonas_sp.AAC.1